MPTPLTRILCGGAHCHTCRSLRWGRGWREAAAAMYEAPAPGYVEAGEGCPQGRPMHDERVDGPVAGACRRCGGRHATADCPIPEGYDPKHYAQDSRGTEPCGC